MAIELTIEQRALVDKQIASGRFATEGEVVGKALQLLERESKREIDMAQFRETLNISRKQNNDLSAEEADELANEAVKWARQNRHQ